MNSTQTTENQTEFPKDLEPGQALFKIRMWEQMAPGDEDGDELRKIDHTKMPIEEINLLMWYVKERSALCRLQADALTKYIENKWPTPAV